MTPPRVLHLCSRLPFPPDAGARIVNWNLARCLRHNGYRLDLICFVPPGEEVPRPVFDTYEQVFPVAADVTRQYPLALARALATGRSYFAVKYNRGAFRNRLERVLDRNRYKRTLIDNPFMGVYLPILERRPEAAGAPLLRLLNVEHEILERLARFERRSTLRRLLRREARLFRRHEIAVVRHVADVRAITRRDASLLGELCGRELDVLPPHIDPGEYTPGDESEIDPQRVLFLGDLSWPPNRNGILRFVRRVWPRLHADLPRTRLEIVGRAPAEIRRLAGDGIDVTGYVDDVRPRLRRAHLVIVPLREGSGIRIKILIALAMGKRVLSTAMGAEGIDYPGLELHDSDDGWQRAASRLLAEPAAVDRPAVEWIRERYSWRRPISL